MIKLAIAVPSNRGHNPRFTDCLIKLTANILQNQDVEGIWHNIMFGCSSLPRARQMAIDSALKHGFTHLLFLDDDMTFPQDMFSVFLKRNVSVLGVNACRKDPEKLRYTALGLDGKCLETEGKTGIEQVARIGFGIVFIDLQALLGIPAPHFEVRWNGSEYVSEDFYFCDKLRNNGVPLYIDNDISQYVGHVGDCEFNYNYYQRLK